MDAMPAPKSWGYFNPVKAQYQCQKHLGGGKEWYLHWWLFVAKAVDDLFLTFDVQGDLEIGEFFALTIELKKIQTGIPLYMEKELEFGPQN